VDLADVRAIMKDAGDAVLGVGEASGKARARLATRQALGSPLQSLEGKSAPTGVIYNLTSGSDLTIQEVRLRMDCFVCLQHERSAVHKGQSVERQSVEGQSVKPLEPYKQLVGKFLVLADFSASGECDELRLRNPASFEVQMSIGGLAELWPVIVLWGL
jgi:hypothetical protein